MKVLAPLALCLAMTAPMAQATVVDFNSDPAPGQGDGSYSSGGLTFTEDGSFGLGIWDSSSPNSNGTNNLIFSDFGGSGSVTITLTGGGIFDLISLDIATSWYSDVSPNGVTINGTPLAISSSLMTYVVNLFGVSSVTISGLDDDFGSTFGNSGYWTVDNIVYQASVVPVPAALPLMVLALGGLGLVASRRRA